jgi:hypothetical protein
MHERMLLLMYEVNHCYLQRIVQAIPALESLPGFLVALVSNMQLLQSIKFL